MRETRADTAQAFGLALLLHAALLLVLFSGLWWTRSAAPASAAGAMSAELVDASALSAAMRRTLSKRPEPAVEPLPEPAPELPEPESQEEPIPQPQAQDLLPEPDRETQEAVVDAPTPLKATETEVQEARRRQEQVDLTQPDRQEDAQRQQRLSQMEAERQKQLDDIRKRRAAAAREAQLAEQKLEQIANARAGRASADAASADVQSSAPGNNGDDAGLQARYAAALQQAILAKWTRPETVPLGAICRLTIRQLPGGEVMDVQVSSPCAYDELGRRSIEAAVLKAQPLPYAGFEAVFQRNLTLNFRAEDG